MKTYILALIMVLAYSLSFSQQDDNKNSDRNNPPKENTIGKEITTNPPKPDVNNVMDNFFPPEMIMRKQKEIGLKDDQQSAIKEEVKKTLSRFTELEWERSAEEEAMISIVKQTPVDENKAMAQFEKILSIEDSIKRVHLEMLIKVNNILSAEQKAKLLEIRKQKDASGKKQDQRRDNRQRDERSDNPPSKDTNDERPEPKARNENPR